MNNELIPDEDHVVIVCSNCGRAWLQLKVCRQVMFNPPLCGKCSVQRTSQKFDDYQTKIHTDKGE